MSKTLGLALGSGGSRGIAHVGFLQALEEEGKACIASAASPLSNTCSLPSKSSVATHLNGMGKSFKNCSDTVEKLGNILDMGLRVFDVMDTAKKFAVLFCENPFAYIFTTILIVPLSFVR